MNENLTVTAFQEQVAMKYQVYNGLFLTLPFENLLKVGVELPVFAELCRTELQRGKSPKAIVEQFFREIAHAKSFEKQVGILLLLLQFVERQVVLFDALEDAAFTTTHDMAGAGSIIHLIKRLTTKNKLEKLFKLLQTYRTRIVLTAHPTQFYPPQVLGIIQDLGKAVGHNDLKEIHDLLLQMGKTSFKSSHKPTPVDEADTLIQYLERTFYPVLKELHYRLSQTFEPYEKKNKFLPALVELGFWPGGDRDGNPNVTAESTLQVAANLKAKILMLYIREIEQLRRRLTFRTVWAQLEKMEARLIATQIIAIKSSEAAPYKHYQEFLDDLMETRNLLMTENQGLFLDKIDKVISAVICFGFHFASLDIRQDSRIHAQVLQKLMTRFAKNRGIPKKLLHASRHYSELSDDEKLQLIQKWLKLPAPPLKNVKAIKDPLVTDMIESLRAVSIIQQANGEKGLHRYVISNTQSAANILEVLLAAHWAGWSIPKLTLDIVPLFETVQDLIDAESIMRALYESPIYKKHLQRRGMQQVIMLGFSDGTKDGGYVTANWEIFKCKKRLADLSKEYHVDVIFFDGRGGPPARGGGNTHKFYRAMENWVDQKQIQLTIQGQTISSTYGTKAAAAFNVEQLFTSGLEAQLFSDPTNRFTKEDFTLLEELSTVSYETYQALKNHPLFIPYLQKITPLSYYGELNIASRPPRRSQSGPLKFEDLRAIPFVGAWSQMKQNVPGFYGLGSALQALINAGKEEELKKIYHHSLFFRTLLENAMQSLKKSFFALTQYLSDDPKFGEFWQMLKAEADLTIEMLKRISGQHHLLDSEPVIQESIQMREDLVLPLLVIQQYALMMMREEKAAKTDKKIGIYREIILKSLAANTNASRNSA